MVFTPYRDLIVAGKTVLANPFAQSVEDDPLNQRPGAYDRGRFRMRYRIFVRDIARAKISRIVDGNNTQINQHLRNAFRWNLALQRHRRTANDGKLILRDDASSGHERVDGETVDRAGRAQVAKQVGPVAFRVALLFEIEETLTLRQEK